jgi:hypothetical protein
LQLGTAVDVYGMQVVRAAHELPLQIVSCVMFG